MLCCCLSTTVNLDKIMSFFWSMYCCFRTLDWRFSKTVTRSISSCTSIFEVSVFTDLLPSFCASLLPILSSRYSCESSNCPSLPLAVQLGQTQGCSVQCVTLLFGLLRSFPNSCGSSDCPCSSAGCTTGQGYSAQCVTFSLALLFP